MSYDPSALLRLYVIEPQTEQDSWGPITNTNLRRVEEAIHGVASLTISGLDVTLDDAVFTGTQSHRHMLLLTGTQVQNCSITVPARDHTYYVVNQTVAPENTGPFSVSVITSGQEDGPSVSHGEKAIFSVISGEVFAFYHEKNFIAPSGGTMAGPLDMAGHAITNVAAPVDADDAATKAFVQDAIAALPPLLYPIGSIYISTLASNPSTYLGFGTWRAYGTGRCLVSAGPTTDARGEFRNVPAIENAGGEYQHVLTISEMPSHNHIQGSESLFNDFGGGTFVANRTYGSGSHSSIRNQLTSSRGLDAPHNNVQPSFSVYVWLRTA